MTRVTTCESCDNREPTGFMRNGECRDCRGIDTPERSRRCGYVSPDYVEQNREAVAHREARNRQRIIQNTTTNE